MYYICIYMLNIHNLFFKSWEKYVDFEDYKYLCIHTYLECGWVI